MAKYHVNQNGEPAICRAVHNCPLGGEGDHIETNSLQEAREFAEKRNAEAISQGSNIATSVSKENNDNTDYSNMAANELLEEAKKVSPGDPKFSELMTEYTNKRYENKESTGNKVASIQEKYLSHLADNATTRSGYLRWNTEEAKKEYEQIVSELDEAHKNHQDAEFDANSAPAWAKEINHSLLEEGSYGAGKLSPYMSEPKLSKDGELIVRPQEAVISASNDGTPVDVDAKGHKTIDRLELYGKPAAGPEARITRDDKGAYNATLKHPDGSEETLSKSRTPEALKKKLAAKLNPRNTLGKANSKTGDRVAVMKSDTGRQILKTAEAKKAFEHYKENEGSANDPDTFKYADEETGLTLENKATYSLRDAGYTTPRTPFRKRTHADHRLGVSKTVVDVEHGYTIRNKNGDIVTAGTKTFNDITAHNNSTGLPKPVGPEARKNSLQGETAMFRRDPKLADGIAEVRKKHGAETADEALKLIRGGGNYGRFDDLKLPEGTDGNVEGIKERLKPFTEIKEGDLKSWDDYPSWQRNSSAAGYEITRNNDSENARRKDKQKAQELLKKLGG